MGKTDRLQPYDYLRRVYAELPQANTVEAIEALLPWNAREVALTEKSVQAEGGED